MFIKQRRVRRSAKFQSKFANTHRRRREYVASMYSMAVIQFVLIAFLIIGAYRSYVLVRDRFGDLVWYGRLALPFIMLAVGVLVLRALYDNIMRIRELRSGRTRSSAD